MLLDSLKTSWKFLKQSLSFFKNNKDLVLLPVISLLTCLMLLALTIFGGVFGLSLMREFAGHSLGVIIVITLFEYFLLSFVVIYFNAALIACATQRLQGTTCSIRSGLGLAAKHWWVLLQWTIISTTISAVIRIIESLHNTLAEIVAAILGVSWSIAAYFVLPILVFENIGTLAALKHSVGLFSREWRKVVGVNLIITTGITAVFAFIYALMLFFPAEKAFLQDLDIILAVAAIIFMATFGNAFNSIVNSALYLDFHKKIDPIGFDKELLRSAFTAKS